MNRIIITMMLLVGGLLPMHAADIKGDINGDGKLTLDDASLLAEVLLGKKTTTAKTDINGDGTLTIADVTKLVDMVLNKKEGGLDIGIGGWEESNEDFGGTVSSLPRFAPSSATGSLSMESLLITPGQTADISIAMTNSADVNGFQATLTLPAGCEFVEASLARKASSHVLMDSGIKDGKIMFVSYSTANSAYSGNSGELLKIRVKAPSNTGSYSACLTGLELSDAAFKTIRPGDVSTDIVVKNKYTLTANASTGGKVEIRNDGLAVSSPFTTWEGTRLSVSATPSEGYHFDSWNDGNKTNPRDVTLTSNTTLTASFATNTYTITYMVDGEAYKSETYQFGAKVTPLAEPTKKGFTFSGWSAIPETMPAHDVEIVGTFQAIEYYIIGDANGDGEINISDYSAIISHILGKDSANANVKAMDVNGDGEVNISDASAIITIILNNKN